MTSAASGVDPLVRRGTTGDAAELAAFAARVFQDTFGPSNRAEDLAQYLASAFSESIQAAELADPALDTWLLHVDGRLAGYAQLRIGPPAPPIADRRAIELRRFYLDRAWQGRGLAQRLMSRMDAVASSRGAASMWLGVWEHNPRAIAFYRKCGFSDVGSQEFVLGTDRQIDRLMWRRLGRRATRMTNDE